MDKQLKPLLFALGLTCVAVPGWAQEALMPSRPRTVVEISVQPGDSVRSVLERVVAAADRAGCKSSGAIEWSEGFFECNREESIRVHHRAAIWLEWKISDPGRTLRVLMSYAKLQEFVGSGWAKVATSSKDEVHNTQELRRQIARVAGL